MANKEFITSLQSKAFTLTELMLVIALLCLLTLAAIPNYQHYTQQAKRQAMLAEMLRLQLLEEHYRLLHYHYAPLSELLLSYPSNIQLSEVKDSYNVTIITDQSEKAPDYFIQATAKNSQKNDHLNNQSCEQLSINAKNIKFPAPCWGET